MSSDASREVVIFTEVMELPLHERAAFLERACAGDAALRRRVEGLLRAHDRVGGFLETPPTGIPMSGVQGALRIEKAGDRIGRYTLLEQIGEGGCGIVFLAEQAEPVRRRVALKIIKPGMDTKSVVARFEAERQALALMDHPGIAKMFDAGSTESGRPYFVMELVRGIKITEYCDQHSLTTEERLKLFVQVCNAVQHAHQKGIIHRDLKPSNILVTATAEGAALPVVIDFGIAKTTTSQRLTDKTNFTAFETLIGTPAYMSPEQAELSSLDVDTRSDIYSLGVLLYELLTGSTPFDTRVLSTAGVDEIRRVIREQEPIRPSTRLSNMARADLTAISKCRQSEPPALIHSVRGDLDWMVMKALEKDRARRYETASGMAMDIQRYLANEPVTARPPSRLYKFQKTVARNKLVFAGAGAGTLLLVVSLAVVSTSLAKERQARRDAETASFRSREVTKFLEEMLSGVDPSIAKGQDTTMLRGILDRTAAQVGPELADQPAVEAELRTVVGRLYEQIGRRDEAEAMQRKALEINRNLFGPESKEAAASLNELGLTLMAESRFQEGEKVIGEALSIRRRLFGNENADTAGSINDLAAMYRQDGQLDVAESMTREALGIRRRLSGGRDDLKVAGSLRDLSIVLGDEFRWAEAEQMSRQVLVIRTNILGLESRESAGTLNDIAWAAGAQGNLAEAQSLEEQALAIRRKILGSEHPDVANSLYLIGDRMRQRGNLTGAVSVLGDALAMQRRVLGKDNPEIGYTLRSLGTAMSDEGKWPEAENVLREALGFLQKWTGKDDGELADAMDKLGSALGAQGKFAEAEVMHRAAAEASRKRLGVENWTTLFQLRSLAMTLEAEGKWPEAETIWRESLAAWRKRAGNQDGESMYTLRKLALALEAEHKWPEAEAAHREALTVSRELGGIDGPESLMDLERVTRVLIAEKKPAEAEQALNEVLTPEFARRQASTNFLTRRIELLGRQGRWQETKSDAALLLQLQPWDHYNYHRLAALLALTGNRAAYEQLCQRVLTNFVNPSSPYVAERMAQDCLLLPHSGVDLDSVDKLADAAMTLGKQESALPYFQACKAMSSYRLGRFPAAIEYGEKAAASPVAEAQAKAYAILAMAHWQLGQKNAARDMLAEGNKLAPAIQPEQGAVDLGDSWVAWIMARVSLDEAADLIRSGSADGANPN